ncbi:hypothetical protein KBB48_02525 [Candidatus Shapirobacteria bacterium]|nr:hypothetical protein [Candidatus Shapirobacteria bacterium]
MNRKIVIFTMSPRQSQFEVDRLETEAGKMGIEVNRALYRELSFDLNPSRPLAASPFDPPSPSASDGRGRGENNRIKARVFVRGEELTVENTMGLWFRVAGTKSGKYTEARNLAIRILRGGNEGRMENNTERRKWDSARTVFCVNEKGYLGWTRMGKIAQHGVFLENNIPIVPTKIFYTREQILNPLGLRPAPLDPTTAMQSDGQSEERLEREMFFDWEYPIIAKHERGYQGKSVRKFENRKEMEDFVNKIDEKNLGMFLWQKYLPTRWDIRVVIVDGKAIGGMKRSAVGDEFRSNFSLGGAVETWNLSEEEKNLAEKVAKVCGLDYGGVDIMKNPKSQNLNSKEYREEDYDNYILEVNRQCQFQGFEKATGINVAKYIVEMIIKRS